MTAQHTSPALLWFRRDDLRLDDHLPLIAAQQSGRPLLCVYIYEDHPPLPALSGAARWWEEQCVSQLATQLKALSGHLITLHGDPLELLPRLAQLSHAQALYYGKHFHPNEQKQEHNLNSILATSGVQSHGFYNSALLPPSFLTTKSDTAFKIFTSFWKALQKHPIPEPQPRPATLQFASLAALPLHDLPHYKAPAHSPAWTAPIYEDWRDTLHAPTRQLDKFAAHDLQHYPTERERPDHEGTSRLSPLLATGMLSPRTIWHAVAQQSAPTEAKECFLSELAWRDFGRYTLHHQPHLPYQALSAKFTNFPWENAPHALSAWQKGQTGIPIIDAGMRQLWQTGWMHNRVRMIVGSFLTKHLLTDWREGEAWFRDTLTDADNASNSMNWQWVAGTGIDASPFFRIFNPLRQAEKFDPAGDYIRHYVPELAALQAPHIFAPWEAPPLMLHQAGITLGKTYPQPMIDLATGRKRALAALAQVNTPPTQQS